MAIQPAEGIVRQVCKERERSRLFGGRMCFNHASYDCARCGRPVCLEHKRDQADGRAFCVTCATGQST